MQNITIGDDVTCIGNYAFEYCSSLQSITIPDSITSIGYCAFYYCRGLQSITISESVTNIGNYCFSNCSSLKYNAYNNDQYLGNENNPYCILMNAFNRSVFDIHPDTKIIASEAYYDCDQLSKVIIPDGVTTVGSFAFYNCDDLHSVTIPDSVTSIGEYAFSNCYYLHNLIIGNGVTSINEYAFYECNSLSHVAYNGTQSQWRNIIIGAFNTSLINAGYFHYETVLRPVVNCINTGLFCPICADFVSREREEDGTHSYESVVTDPDCTNEGYTTYTCSVCSDSYAAEHTEALGHSVQDGVCIVCKTVLISVATQPADQTVKADTTAKFTVKATGKGLTYQWQYRTSSKGSWKNVSAAIGKTASYSLTAQTRHSGYQYRCVVTDREGNKVYSNAVNLYVLGINSQPTTQKVKAGDTAKFTVSATGANKTYQWQYRKSSSGSWKNASATGNKTATLSVPASVSRHGYQYRCRITDSAGNKVYTKTVTLNVLGIKTQPVSKTVVDGGTAKFTVAATGKGLTYQWQYRTSSSGSWKNTSAIGNKTNTLSVAATVAKHGYQYRCKVTDSAGNTVYTSVVNLYVLGIKTQPASRTVKAGATAKFTVAATGRGLTFQWQYRTSSSGSWKNVSVASGKTANYSLTAAARHNGYQYRCKITDSAGNVIYTKTVKLTVK